MRDAEHHALVREIAAMRWGPHMAGYEEILGAKLRPKQRALLRLALSFFTWRTLIREARMKPASAVDAMVESIVAQNGS